MSSPAYIMESELEAERLEAKTDSALTRSLLQRVSFQPGMRALDAGAATGAVARVMAQWEGNKAEVVALDGSAHRLSVGRKLAEAEGLSNLSFIQGDLYAPPLAPQSFDFVWCRFVFEYLNDPDLALRQLIDLTRPGGKVVVGNQDGDFLFHHPLPEALAPGLSRLESALKGRFDPYAGRKLFHRFRKAGLVDIQVHCLPYHLFAGTIPQRDRNNWVAKFQTVRPLGVAVLGGEAAYDAFVKAYLEMLDDPDSLTYSMLFLVEGVRPLSSSANAGT